MRKLAREIAPLPQFTWPAAPRGVALSSGQVHLWAANLDVTPATLEHYASCLAPPEANRAARFYFERDRNRFIAGRGWLRTLLADYAQTGPRSIEFDYGANGKPRLGGRFVPMGLEFNLAHCENLALLAIARGQPLGVDVERVRPIADADQLVSQFFSPRENAAFQQLSPDQKPNAFFNLWTRKEAWLKAIGEGIAHSLSLVEVSFLPGEPARLLAAPPTLSEACWTLQELAPAQGFVGALASPEVVQSFHALQWCGDPPYRTGKCN